MTWFATSKESDSTFDELPEGTYRFIVTNATVKATKQGGQMAEATLEVVEGALKGQKCWARFNVENANATAQRIGRAEMKRFLTACGVTEDLTHPKDFGRAVGHKVVWGEVVHERKDNKTFVRVGGFTADVPGAPEPQRAAPRTAATDAIPF
jgi:hypothetical protein